MQTPFFIDRAAELMGINQRTLANRISAKRHGRDPRGPVPPYVQTGPRSMVFPVELFEEFLDQLTVAGYIPEKPKPKRGRANRRRAKPIVQKPRAK